MSWIILCLSACKFQPKTFERTITFCCECTTSKMLLSVCVCIGATTYMENSATVSPLVFKHVRFTTCTGKGYKFSTVYMNRSQAMGNHLLVMNVERQTWYGFWNVRYCLWYVNARVMHASECRFMCCCSFSSSALHFLRVANLRSTR